MSDLAETILAEIRDRPRQFHEVVEHHMDVPWRELLRAWGELRAAELLGRDDDGNYIVAAKG